MQSWRLFLPLLVHFWLSGCASKIPASFPVAENEKTYLLETFNAFRAEQCSTTLDADITIDWQGYGKKEVFPGMLQVQDPGYLRYAIVDPLGRQLLILVSDSEDFTLVNNKKGKAYVGQTDSSFWQRYIPSYLYPEDYLSWLTGRVPANGFEIQDIRQDKQSPQQIWFISSWQNDIRHRIQYDLEAKNILRHMVEGLERNVWLDVAYSDYAINSNTCNKPMLLQISGSDISGNLTIHYDEFFSTPALSPNNFQLHIPDHFSLETVK